MSKQVLVYEETEGCWHRECIKEAHHYALLLAEMFNRPSCTLPTSEQPFILTQEHAHECYLHAIVPHYPRYPDTFSFYLVYLTLNDGQKVKIWLEERE